MGRWRGQDVSTRGGGACCCARVSTILRAPVNRAPIGAWCMVAHDRGHPHPRTPTPPPTPTARHQRACHASCRMLCLVHGVRPSPPRAQQGWRDRAAWGRELPRAHLARDPSSAGQPLHEVQGARPWRARHNSFVPDVRCTGLHRILLGSTALLHGDVPNKLRKLSNLHWRGLEACSKHRAVDPKGHLASVRAPWPH